MEDWQRYPWRRTEVEPPPLGSRVVATESVVHKAVLYDYTSAGEWKSVCPTPVGVVSNAPPLWMPIRDVA